VRRAFAVLAFLIAASILLLIFKSARQDSPDAHPATPPIPDSPATPLNETPARCEWTHWSADLPDQPRLVFIGDSQPGPVAAAPFACVRVDPQRRPDVARAYLLAASILAGPMEMPAVVFTFGDGRPFAAMPWSGEIALERAAEQFARVLDFDRVSLEQRADDCIRSLRSGLPEPAEAPPRIGDLIRVALPRFDSSFGGWGESAKSPNAPLLLALTQIPDSPEAERMAMHSLYAMAHGAIRDHVGAGFFSASTTPDWRQPRFEKRADVNAALALAYLRAYRRTPDPELRDAARSALECLATELLREDGTFAAAVRGTEDYYTWTPSEFFAAVGMDWAEQMAIHFHILPGARRVPFPVEPPEVRAEIIGVPVDEFLAARRQALADLRAVRERRRPAPERSEVTSAYLCGIAALAFATAAHEGGWDGGGEIARRAVEAALEPFLLEDYAALALARIALGESEEALRLTEDARRRLRDPAGWYAPSPERLFLTIPDGRGNGLAALAWVRLGRASEADAIHRALGSTYESDLAGSQWLWWALAEESAARR
jgi:uncharacterized protein YyaL (SSP411 family)